ncbi:ATP-binding protein [Fictibacillus norfolkensis]|uniref:AAA family ATPase n=1 Tax=Fictibacillus norfolkensis TaxID=2762233 RepID=A0ABR8SPT9_9BACL|nr:AAA family ATPase [Fictibacillus norfolkensis]MBD7965506.1 AAA family ATPase [Fictibacillus norfolkensis]
MKLVTLHIYHFGGLKDCKISFEEKGLQILYGENEAGKTTLMDFIKCMFYGFPTKSQNQRRYEPKDGNRMGGKITIHHQVHGTWTIERVAHSTVTGDLRLYDESGQQKEEAFLLQLLDGMEQSLYTGAFCFGLDGLQKLDKLSSEELGNFLLSTAISGDRDLLDIEQTFEKKQALLFKKAGKKPIINERLEQLSSSAKSLQLLKEKNENYQALTNEKDGHEKELEVIKQKLTEIQTELLSNKRLLELKPVLQRYKQLDVEIRSFDSESYSFPENGLQQYEELRKELSRLKSDLTYDDSRLQDAEAELGSIISNENIIRYETEIKRLFNLLPEYEHLFNQLQELQRHIQSLRKEESQLFDEIGEAWSEKELKGLSLSLSSLHFLEDLIRQNEQIQDKKSRLEDELEDSRVKLERFETEEAKQKKKLLSEEEYAKYEHSNHKETRKVSFYTTLLPILSSLLLLWSGWVSNHPPVMLGGVLLLITSLVLSFLYLKRNPSGEEMPKHVHQRLLEDEVHRKQWLELSLQLSNENNIYVQLAKRLDYLEVEEASVWDHAKRWAHDQGYRGKLDRLFVSGYMKRVLQLKELLRQRNETENKVQDIEFKQSSYEKKASSLSHAFGKELQEDTKSWINSCYAELEKQLKNQSRSEHIQQSKKELLERKNELQKKISFIDIQIRSLWDAAKVSNEADFYVKGKNKERFGKLTEERETLFNQFISLGFSNDEIAVMAEKVTVNYETTLHHISILEEQVQEKQKGYDEKIEAKGKLDWEIAKLLEDGSYSENLHRYEMLKEEWNTLVKKWASLRLAQHALSKVKEDYQKTKLPAVLETSSVYFSKITESEYQSITFTDNNELMVLNGDGLGFYPHELSRGTAEQVYLAIRLAVAFHAGPRDFPILMDDIAVNFDGLRTKRTLQLIQETAFNRQVLFFTCHKHITSTVPAVPVIHWPHQSVIAEM